MGFPGDLSGHTQYSHRGGRASNLRNPEYPSCHANVENTQGSCWSTHTQSSAVWEVFEK